MDKDQEAVAAKRILAIAQQVKERENLDTVAPYRKLAKKIIALPHRSWVLGYLLRERLKNGNKSSSNDQVVSLFVGVGRNRQITSRDLVRFLLSKGRISRSAIREIQIHSGYSFVQVKKEIAGELVLKTNGHLLRGKKVRVNIASEDPSKKRS